jgi:hypothetical protein
MEENLFAPPRNITDISECYFYHVTDLPGYGQVGEEWDLRGGEESYVGGVSFQGKRVLELGTASGYLCRYMERSGADVIGFDLPADRFWDLVPFAGLDLASARIGMRDHIEKLKNGWWFAHRLFGSRAKAIYGNIYDIPQEIGPVDISTFGSILLHLRDPFQALYSASRLTREAVIVTDVHPDQSPRIVAPDPPLLGRIYLALNRRVERFLTKGRLISPTAPVVENAGRMYFVPNPHEPSSGQTATWWVFTPEVMCCFLAVLGFGDQVLTEHFQTFQGKKIRLYTVVARRTQGRVEDSSKQS